jgi:thiosulfate reductase cytochrome b subunit
MTNAETLHDVIRDELRYRESHVSSANAADATLYWFVMASLASFLIAGLLVYRDATSDAHVESSGARPISVAKASSPVEQPPMHTHVEGVDP